MTFKDQLKKRLGLPVIHSEAALKELILLTITSFKAQAGRDAVDNDEADDVAAVILNEAFELLDLLLDGVPDVLLAFRIHINIWSSDT